MSVRAARIEEGREDWLADLYQAHARAVHGYCRRFLNSPDDAADATQEVFVRAIRSLQAPAESPQARRWLITVAQNYCLDLMRRRRRMQTALTVLASDGSQHDSETEVTNRRLLQAVLNRLGPRERKALWQSAVEHRSVGEIATSLGISYMAAAQVLHRARKHAAAVAAKLGAILGLAGANALRRRPRALGLAQTLAAMAIAPLVIAVATPSSSGQAADLLQHSPKTSVKASPGSLAPANPSAQLLIQSSTEPNDHRLRSIRRKLGTAVHSLLGTVTQTVDQLTSQVSGIAPRVVVPNPPALPSPPVLPTALPTPPISR